MTISLGFIFILADNGPHQPLSLPRFACAVPTPTGALRAGFDRRRSSPQFSLHQPRASLFSYLD